MLSGRRSRRADLPERFGPLADGVEAAREVQQGRHLGPDPDSGAHGGGCFRADRLGREHRFHGQPCTPARDEPAGVILAGSPHLAPHDLSARHPGAVLRQTGHMGHTVIQVPVPELEPLVRRLVIAANPGMNVHEPATVCAHITLLGPFVDRPGVNAELMRTLRGLLAPVRPFTFELSSVERFSSGLVYLAPNRAEPFKQLTEVLAAAFPDWPPYGGAFDDVVPHLSISEELPEPELAAIQERLPIAATAEEVTPTWWSDDTITTLASFPLLQ
jgi:2'-5' RNA ligase superfamily